MSSTIKTCHGIWKIKTEKGREKRWKWVEVEVWVLCNKQWKLRKGDKNEILIKDKKYKINRQWKVI